ncbi:MAG: hypothetical protein AB7O50_00390 [Pseudolabrys sp.]
MDQGLRSWREDLPSAFVRGLAVLCGLFVLSFIAGRVFQSPAIVATTAPKPRPDWIEIAKPFPAFALSIPEATDAPFNYAIRRHAAGGGRIDILTLGTPDADAPFLQVEVYRPGNETFRFGEAASEMLARAGHLVPSELTALREAIETKFGPISVAAFRTGAGQRKSCIGFSRGFYDPMLQITGWFCQSGDTFVTPETLACALDRFTLLSAGSEPKVGELFAHAELKRSFCGQRSPLLTPTPKHKALWTALEQRAGTQAR